MKTQRFADLVANGMQRRQRGHRLLENNRNPTAADRSHRRAVARQLGEIDDVTIAAGIGKQNLATGNDAITWQNAKNSLTDHRLTRSGFTDKSHGRSCSNEKRNT